MIDRIGRKMGLRWRVASGCTAKKWGPTLLARLAASDIARLIDRPGAVHTEHVERVIGEFPTRHNAALLQMVESLQMYYPEELDLLRLIAARDELANDWAKTYPSAANHLRDYGILDASGALEIRLPVLRDWLVREGGAP